MRFPTDELLTNTTPQKRIQVASFLLIFQEVVAL